MQKSIITLVTLVIGAVEGVSTLSVLAQTGNWTPPTQTPPGGNVAAPVNIGSTSQTKTGLLGVGGLVTTNLVLSTSSPTWGKVLMSIDNSGTAKWVATSTLGLGGGGASGVSRIIAGTNITISPTTGVGNVTVNASSQTPSPVQYGLYGQCRQQLDTSDVTVYPPFILMTPAQIGRYDCVCPSGYTKVPTSGATGNNITFYSCYKN